MPTIVTIQAKGRRVELLTVNPNTGTETKKIIDLNHTESVEIERDCELSLRELTEPMLGTSPLPASEKTG